MAQSTAQPQASQPQPIIVAIAKLILSAQFLWVVGHMVTVFQTISYFITSKYRDGSEARHYSKAFYGIILSYGISVYKSQGMPKMTAAYRHSVMKDENAQYLILAFIWAFCKPFIVTLLPFFTFAVFHVLRWINTVMIPTFFTTTEGTIMKTVQTTVSGFVSKYQSAALTYAAYAEVWLVLPGLIIGVPLGWASWFAPFLYARFLAFRILFSPVTKEVFATTRSAMDAQASKLPPAANQMYQKARDFLIHSVNVGAEPQPTPARSTTTTGRSS